jgi:hypothetical protein
MLVEFLAAARVELAEAISHYDLQREKLADEFLLEFRHAVEKIRSRPRAYPKVTRKFRRHILDRFPYSIIYQPEADRIVIIAVAHLHRRPRYWRGRR